jgi:predicted ester cyclase
MKKILIAAATGLLCLFISCKDAGPSSTLDEAQKNSDANNRVMKAIGTGDSLTIDSLIGDDAVDHMGPNGQEVHGGDKIKHMLIDMHNHLKDMKFDIISTAANGDYVFTLSNISGTTTDSSMGMAAGTKMYEKTVDVVRVKDGKMEEHWGFVDPAAMMKHMQEMPAMPPMDHKMDTINKK